MRKTLLIIILILLIWSFFIEPNMLVINEQNIRITALDKIKIICVGDFHVKPYQKYRLKYVVKQINEQHPDLILFVGDFVSGHDPKQSMSIENIAKEFIILRPKYGIYTVLGNHDWWQNGENITKVLEKNGITVLANENKFINIECKKLYIAGVEDYTTRAIDIVSTLKEAKSPTILLTHNPDIFPFITNKNNFKITKKADLVLAGHTHGGQVRIPFLGALIVPSNYKNKYAEGLVNENGRKMFVTKGVGTSILPVRFNCVPEIVVININK